MKCRIEFIVIVLLSLGMLATGCVNSTTRTVFNNYSSTSTTLISPTTTNSNSVNSTNSIIGPNLSLSLDGTIYQPGQEIAIVVDEKNTLATMNNVRASDNWPLSGLVRMYLGPCGYPNIPVGIAIFPGIYTPDSVLNATPLNLYNPNGVYGCTAVINPTSYSFKPSSDKANIIGDSNSIISKGQQIKYKITLKGFWTNNSNSSFSYFDPGVYTVVSGDEWGSLVFVHFTVSNSATTTTSTTTLENIPIKIISVSNTYVNGPIDNPTGELNLENVSTESIVSLSAVLVEFAPQDYNFGFDVTSNNPLLPGENVIGISYLFEGKFGSGISYSLKISGTYQNGKTFNFTWEPPNN